MGNISCGAPGCDYPECLVNDSNNGMSVCRRQCCEYCGQYHQCEDLCMFVPIGCENCGRVGSDCECDMPQPVTSPEALAMAAYLRDKIRKFL